MKNRNIIVFGGSGFLGSHVADALSGAGHKVTIFDRVPSRYLRRDQKMRVGDILDPAAVQDAMKGQEIVYNFAGYSDLDTARNHPLDTVKLNILGNCHILEAAKDHRIKRYIFASTVYVYSQTGSFYRASKQSCESYIESYNQVYGLPYTILRFGSLYGPRSDQRNAIYGYLRQAVESKKIVYCGTGQELREFIHVQDAALCSVDILADDYENKCVILTGSQPMRVKDILMMIHEIMGKKVKIELKPVSKSKTKDLHYAVTPYSFIPQEAKKLVRLHYTDIGQGLVGVLQGIYAEVQEKKEV